jgi:hypothetical protein
VLAVPVVLWVLIGHVVAPIFVQKVVIRGGSVIQGFAGTVFSAVGASSLAIYSGGMVGAANWLAHMKQNTARDEHEARPVEYVASQGPGESFVEPTAASALDQGEASVQSGSPLFRGARGQEHFTRGMTGIGPGMMGAGAAMMNRFGSVARFIGHAVVEGSGDGSGLEYRALAAFGPNGRSSRTTTNSANRSSLQARRYIDEV